MYQSELEYKQMLEREKAVVDRLNKALGIELPNNPEAPAMQNNITIDGFKIATWYSEGVEAPYQAVNMTVAIDQLEGYKLTEEEKTELPALMAGYCRLIEEYGLVGFGDTEFESIRDLFSNAVKVNS